MTVADDENPVIALSSTSVDEGKPAGTAVGTLSVLNYSGAGGTVSFALASGDGSEDKGFFAVEGDKLVTGKSFDYETDEKHTYNVRVSVSDSGELIVSKPFSITVTDVTLPGDDRVDMSDAVSLLKILANSETYPAGDLNGDERCDLKDFILILKMLVGL